jgi:hypothetical protein
MARSGRNQAANPISTPRCLGSAADNVQRLSGCGWRRPLYVESNLRLPRHSEDNVEVGHRQQFGLSAGQPLSTREPFGISGSACCGRNCRRCEATDRPFRSKGVPLAEGFRYGLWGTAANGLRFFTDGAAKKWPLRGSLKLGTRPGSVCQREWRDTNLATPRVPSPTPHGQARSADLNYARDIFDLDLNTAVMPSA